MLRLPRILAAAAALCLTAAFAQQPPPVKFDGRPRALAASQRHGLVFVALYDSGTVAAAPLDGPQTTWRTQVGRGPAALALSSDEARLAVCCQLSGEVTVLSAPELEEVGRYAIGKGPAAVAALPGGGFAAVSAFSDELTLIAADGAESRADFSELGRVPACIAADSDFIAIGVSVPPGLVRLSTATGKRSRADLPQPPDAIAALGDGRFAVAFPNEVRIIDARNGVSDQARRLVAEALLPFDGGLLAFTADGALLLDDAFEATPLGSLEAEGPYAAVGRTLVALSEDGVVTRHAMGALPEDEERPPQLGLTALEPQTLEPAPAPSPPEEAELQMDEGDEPTVYPGSPLPEPAPDKRAGGLSSVEAPASRVYRPRLRALAAVEDAGASDQTAGDEPAEIVAPPKGAFELRAPRPPARPDGLPQEGPAEAVSRVFQNLPLGRVEGGFTQPDLEGVLDNIEADVLERDARGVWRAKGNVFALLGDKAITAEEMVFDPEGGVIELTGDVVITEAKARLSAERLRFVAPVREELAEDEVSPVPDENGGAYLRGRLEAEALHVREPRRELRATAISFDFTDYTGRAEGLKGRLGQLYFGAERFEAKGPESYLAEDLYVTTCSQDPPDVAFRMERAEVTQGEAVLGEDVNLALAGVRTPVYWPRLRLQTARDARLSFDFDSGHAAEIGYYVNVGQRFDVSRDASLGLRLMPTEKEGVGFGLEGAYDYMETPASRLFRNRGEFRGMLTTEDRGYLEFHNRYEPLHDTVVLMQAEQWSDGDFMKDFFYERYRNRTEPRTFADATYRQPGYLAGLSVAQTTTDFVAGTERMPEGSFRFFERELLPRIYVSYDALGGYLEREPAGTHSTRVTNALRFTGDLDLHESVAVTPFTELEGTWYSDDNEGGDGDARFSATSGVTAQARLHRVYDGAFGFSAVKHVLLPSVTYSYRPEPTMGIEETPRFDVYDNVYGRSRFETKVDNVFLGRDAASGEVWQVARVSFYQGNDFWNELRGSDDYEVEVDIRPRPWWGLQFVGERHSIEEDLDIDAPFALRRLFLEAYERAFDEPFDAEANYRYNARYGDYDRVLTSLYYNDQSYAGRFTARLGFAYTETQDRLFNREILYGLGYRANDTWSFAFEHRYDFDRDELLRQMYEIRRTVHCWEAAVNITDRSEGWDVGMEFSLTAFPGQKVKF